MPSFVRAQLDYYSALGIAPEAGTVEVNAAFRRLAWRYHPDRNPAPGATVKFQDINEAHQVLSDPARRAAYDARWHPDCQLRRYTASSPHHPHAHRVKHRSYRVRAGLLFLLAFVFVASAWVALLAAATSMHHSPSAYVGDASWPFPDEALEDGTFSMEMYPVPYTDEQGRRLATWETDIRTSWGGSARVSSIPDLQPQFAFGTLDRSSLR
jgi:curved DNA-binding protein CbpA